MVVVEVSDFKSWRATARRLLIAHIKPEQVNWTCSQQASLFSAQASQLDSKSNPITVPMQFISMAIRVACFQSKEEASQKWALMYALLWRITNVDRNTMSMQTDIQVRLFLRMLKAVDRDMHKMKAFVRFQEKRVISNNESEHYYTAWFEPDHAIVELVAPFFTKRFTGMDWSILTPLGCAHWNKQELKISAGTHRPELLQDDYEVFWKTYYCNIFNPARLKEKAMMSEMPKKYWKYLPEAQCIKSLTDNATSQMTAMLENDVTDSERVRKKSESVRDLQEKLRKSNQT